MKRWALWLLVGMPLHADITALPEVPGRVFLADARLSFPLPDQWKLMERKTALPILQRTITPNHPADIRVEVATQLKIDGLREDVPVETLKEFARRDIQARDPQTRILASETRELLGRRVYEVTWQQGASVDEGLMHQSLYFFIGDRFIVVSLNSSRADFPTLVTEFQTWLASLRVLSRQQAGALDAPARGGLYLNLAGRLRMPIPDHWLVGVANDRTLGLGIVQEEWEGSFTLTAEPLSKESEWTDRTRKEARESLTKRGLRIQQTDDNPFHGYPAYSLAFDGNKNGKFIKGQDIWVMSPTAQWLISIEGDGPLVNRLQSDFRKMLDAIEFL